MEHLRGRLHLMSWRVINIGLAVLAGLVCLYGIATRDLWRALPGGACSVLFVLLAAEVQVFGHTGRALERLRDGRHE